MLTSRRHGLCSCAYLVMTYILGSAFLVDPSTSEEKTVAEQKVRTGTGRTLGFFILFFGFVWGVLSPFVARKARRGARKARTWGFVLRSFVVKNGPQPWPWPLILMARV